MAVRFLSSENIDGVLTFSTTGTFGNNASITHYTNNYLYIRGGSAGLVVGDNTSATRAEFSSSNFITWEINSNAAMHINSSRNLGVGTSNPNHRVDIYSNENIPLRIHRPSNSNLNSAGAHGIGFSTRSDAVTSTTDTRSGIFSYYNGNLFFATNTSNIESDPDGSARMTILNTGYVGINTTNPLSQFDVRGAVYVTGYTVGFDTSPQGNYAYRLTNDGGNSFINVQGGNLGVGTSSPAEKLHVNSGTGNVPALFESTDNLSLITFKDNNTTTDVGIGADDNDEVFYAGGSERMRIDSSGNVGIGGAPGQNLDIQKTGARFRMIDGTNQFNMGLWDGANYRFEGDANRPIYMTSYQGNINFGISGNTTMTIQSGGVGIGTTSPSGKLEVITANGFSRFWSNNASAYHFVSIGRNASDLELGSAAAANQFFTGTASGEAVIKAPSSKLHLGYGSAAPAITIDTSNRVGIGTTLPNAKLDIKGSAGSPATSGTTQNGILRIQNATNNNTLDIGQVASTPYGTWLQAADKSDLNPIYTYPLILNPNGGNVGIGTASPSYKLHVVNSGASAMWIAENDSASSPSTNAPALTIQNTNTNDNVWTGINFADAGGQVASAIYSAFTSQANNYGIQSFYTRGSDGYNERLRITETGNVGIGTSSPSNRFVIKEGTNTDMEFGSEANGCFIQTYNRTSSSWGYLRFIAGGGERMRITQSGGEVLINHTSDLTGQILQVNGMIDQTDVTKAVRVYDGTTFLGGVGSGQWAFSATYANDYAIYAQNDLLFHAGTGSSIDMMIDGATHNVGIGTTSIGAGYKLQVKRDTNVNIGFGLQNSGASLEAVNDAINANIPLSLYGSKILLLNGNVGIGTTSPGTALDVNGVIRTSNVASDKKLQFQRTGGNQFSLEHDSGRLYFYNESTSNPLLTMLNSGFVGIGTTSPSDKLEVTTSASQYTGRFDYTGSSGGAYGCLKLRISANTSPSFIDFFYDGFSTSPTSPVGAIVTTGSGVLYSSYSDYRLKENVADLTGALNKVNSLQPKTFNYINSPETTNEGFLAHELQEIVPQAVSGTKDGVDEDGNPKYQGVDNAHLVPLLVGAIKELKAEIENLKSQIQ